MTRELPELLDALVELTESTAPASRVSAERAMRDGRARQRRRQWAAVGAAGTAAVAVAAAVAATTLPLNEPSGKRSSVTATVSAAPTPATLPADPGTGADPLTTEVQFGWLPDSLAGPGGFGYTVDYQNPDQRVATVQARSTVSNAAGIQLRLYPVGPEPTLPPVLPGDSPPQKKDAPPVAGHPAYWITRDASGPAQPDIVLRWQTPSGRWAELTTNSVLLPDASAVLPRIAADVRYGHWVVPMPLRFTGLPADFKVQYVSVSRPGMGNGAWLATLALSVKNSLITVSVGPAEPVPAAGSSYPGKSLHNGKPSGTPDCTSGQGVDVCVDSPPGYGAALNGVGGVPGVLSKITLLGSDEHKWTTQVMG